MVDIEFLPPILHHYCQNRICVAEKRGKMKEEKSNDCHLDGNGKKRKERNKNKMPFLAAPGANQGLRDLHAFSLFAGILFSFFPFYFLVFLFFNDSFSAFFFVFFSHNSFSFSNSHHKIVEPKILEFKSNFKLRSSSIFFLVM